MFLKQSVNNLKNYKTTWKSNWFVKDSFNYKRHIYEDIFIRKYVSSFFFKWSKFFTNKVVGSIYLFRTYGKLYISVYFFCPIVKQKPFVSKRKIKLKQEVFYKNSIIKPVDKYKKHLTILLFFYQLEKILGVQIFFKFRNICTSLVNSKFTTSIMLRINNYLANKFVFFKYQFKEETYLNTVMFLINLFKFKVPDGVLLANYIAKVLPFIQKHNQFLMFIRRILCTLKKIFKFNGVKILISGKLNGFTRAQSKQIQVGCVPLQSYKIFYIEGRSHAFTNSGKIGIKIWIC
uniref:ribosomal protein S3 n=1 Tax=Polymyxa betae TaxID=41456 RepID=UPI001D12903A|nr:ribosomal protein S3 [Polymyxa betae]CAG9644881.1 ribosomal protein S3 [Polymyxa betae]